MTVIADLTVPADALALGPALVGSEAAEVELVPVVPVREGVVPLVRVSSADATAAGAALAVAPRVERVTRLADGSDGTLFEVRLAARPDPVVGALVDTGGVLLAATGSADGWELRLRFTAHEGLSAFNAALADAGVPVTLRHLYNPTPPAERPTLSAEQHEALAAAHRRGFFEVPRRVTLVELAADLGISDSALSQRMRRGLAVAVEQALDEPGGA